MSLLKPALLLRGQPVARSLGWLAAAALLAGCNHYEWFQVVGANQADFSNDADILFVIDNSGSMLDKSAALALNFDVFIRQLSDPTQGGHGTEGLPDAVDAYIDYVQNRAFVVDYQLAITTTDVAARYGDLYGDPRIIPNSYDGDIPSAFNRNLLCEATTIQSRTDLVSDPSYTCADPPPPPGDAVSQEYMDCLCGGSDWLNPAGSGTEEPLEAVFMAMCRAVEDPPAACYEFNGGETLFAVNDAVMTNAGLMRPDSTLIPIIISDEGDDSRRKEENGDGEPDEYADLFAEFDHRMTFAVIGPEPSPNACNTTEVPEWTVDRLEWVVNQTDGRFFQITKPESEGCGVADFATAMDQLGDLLNGLRTTFILKGVPDVDTIRCFVDGAPVDRSVETFDDALGTVSYTDGWSYDAVQNSVRFHGSAVPDYGVSVEIYYRPIQGMPRDLPF